MKNKGLLIALIALGIIVITIVIALIAGFSTYNNLVKLDEDANRQWSVVENQYQRRADLIPNLVKTVQGYANHEKSTLDAVISARAKATQVTIDPQNMNAENMAKYQAAQGQLSQALGRLLMVSENYPNLKADKNFMELQAELSGTENRIATERTRFSDIVAVYNTAIRRFPANIVAGIGGFDRKAQFKAEEGAEKAPEVNFDK